MQCFWLTYAVPVDGSTTNLQDHEASRHHEVLFAAVAVGGVVLLVLVVALCAGHGR